METQNKRIRQYLESGRSLTPLEALYSFGTLRLSARICDLRREGMVIDSKTIEVTSPSVYSGKKHVKVYFIKRK